MSVVSPQSLGTCKERCHKRNRPPGTAEQYLRRDELRLRRSRHSPSLRANACPPQAAVWNCGAACWVLRRTRFWQAVHHTQWHDGLREVPFGHRTLPRARKVAVRFSGLRDTQPVRGTRRGLLPVVGVPQHLVQDEYRLPSAARAPATAGAAGRGPGLERIGATARVSRGTVGPVCKSSSSKSIFMGERRPLRQLGCVIPTRLRALTRDPFPSQRIGPILRRKRPRDASTSGGMART